MAEKLNVIAIDGPAGSGKSTVAKGIARKLNFVYVDTGAMYRALTLKALRKDVDLNDGAVLEELSGSTDIKLERAGEDDTSKVFLDGEDVSGEIRDLSVSDKVRFIARVPGVRGNMVEKQRMIASQYKGAVLEGRDIGTVVFPDAKYKFYVDASFGERVRRRFDELKARGMNVSRNRVEKDLETRDRTDMARDVGPLKKADDAVYFDTTSLSIEEVISGILGKITI